MIRQALAVAAKAPEPGKAKTRLQSFLSVEDATELYRCFLKDTLALVDSIPETDGVVSYTPEGAEKYFEGITGGHHLLLPQRGSSFGERLCNALEDLLDRGYGCAAIMDSDSPTLPSEYLLKTFELLRMPGQRVVLGPASDGGYYLIGLNESHPRLFEDITWSTSSVLRETIERANEIGLEVALLPEWYDVDDREGFDRLCRELGTSAGRDTLSAGPGKPNFTALDLKGDAEGTGPEAAETTRRFICDRWPAKKAYAYD